MLVIARKYFSQQQALGSLLALERDGLVSRSSAPEVVYLLIFNAIRVTVIGDTYIRNFVILVTVRWNWKIPINILIPEVQLDRRKVK